jgi:hypothetical protein
VFAPDDVISVCVVSDTTDTTESAEPTIHDTQTTPNSGNVNVTQAVSSQVDTTEPTVPDNVTNSPANGTTIPTESTASIHATSLPIVDDGTISPFTTDEIGTRPPPGTCTICGYPGYRSLGTCKCPLIDTPSTTTPRNTSTTPNTTVTTPPRPTTTTATTTAAATTSLKSTTTTAIDTSEPNTTTRGARIISNKETVQPFVAFGHSLSYENGHGLHADGFAFFMGDRIFPSLADGSYFTLSSRTETDKLPTVQYADDFSVSISQDEIKTIGYTLYNIETEEILRYSDNFSMTKTRGEYILRIEIWWKGEIPDTPQPHTPYVAMYYFFKIIVN